MVRTASLVLALLCGGPASALTVQECSAKYNAAKQAGTLGDMKWNAFRKAQCGEAAPAAAAGAAEPVAAPSANREPPASANAAAPAPTPAATGPAVYPAAVDPKYTKETAGKARMKTCVDQYHANKATGGNGGLKWIAKGGGYYSECNKRLKG